MAGSTHLLAPKAARLSDFRTFPAQKEFEAWGEMETVNQLDRRERVSSDFWNH
jgi:hypothetical protein